MENITITKIFEFEAAHFLPDYEGNCRDLHGHTYKLEVEVGDICEKLPSPSGMIMDFKKLKMLVGVYILRKLDHTLLNNLIRNPTAEEIVRWIHERLTPRLIDVAVLRGIRLWETSNSYAEWRAQ